MATTYLSPGVYVEEVPSAQQPIAGVGTNTVGFIGLVPKRIQCLEPNDEYDPKLADLLARKPDDEAAKAQLQALKDNRNAKDQDNKRAEREVARIEGELARTNQQIKDREAELAKPPADAAAPARKPKEDSRLAELGTHRDKLTADLDTARRALGGAKDDDFLLPYRTVEFAVTTPVGATKLCTNFTEYTDRFGTYSDGTFPGHRALTHAVAGFFKNGGTRCFVARIEAEEGDQLERALRSFQSLDEVSILAAPGLTGPNVWQQLVAHCELMQDRFAILDSRKDVEKDGELDVTLLNYGSGPVPEGGPAIPERDRNAAFYFPWVQVFDPAQQLIDARAGSAIAPRDRGLVHVPPSGHVAGVYARVDAQRGVHKAPANEKIFGVNNVRYYISRHKQDLLNPQGVNCIRNINGNISIFGGRTIGGDRNGEWKYVNVRRVMLFLKESIDEGTQWVVFEPNDPSLWAKIRLNVGAFLTRVWRDGALFGTTPAEAFYVKCDAETNPPEVRDAGQVIIEVGVAIVRPAEFVVFRITQWSGPMKS